MEHIRNTIDQLYRENKHEEAYQYLLDSFEQAMMKKDDLLVLGILSELMGYYRVHAMFDLGNTMAKNAIKILYNMQLENSIIAATTYLNIATLYRAQKQNKASLEYFNKCLSIYTISLNESDERFISLYNNMSLVYVELNELDNALLYANKAIQLLQIENTNKTYIAITYTNISQIYFNQNKVKEGKDSLEKAITLFKQYDSDSPHYNAALASLAHYHYLQKEYEEALSIYELVMHQIEIKYGKNKDYESVLENYNHIKKISKQGIGLSLCKEYYETHGKQMIETKFSHVYPYMAIGLVGLGSQCLGYDDHISIDHDYGPNFCIFLPRDIYELYGKEIQQSYDSLPITFNGYTRTISKQGSGRDGVICIEDFIYSFIGTNDLNNINYFLFNEMNLLNIVNGELWVDNLGMFTSIRKQLAYYPDDIRYKKLTKSLALIAQAGQYNYNRCVQRKDIIASTLALNEFINETLSCIYLLNKVYKPFYKWSHYGLSALPLLSNISKKLELLLSENNKKDMIEDICIEIANELQRQKLTSHNDPFLQTHVEEIMNLIQDKKIRNMHVLEG